jgi:hypothetical protein
MIKSKMTAFFFLVVLSGCASGSVSPGITLWAGLKNYREEMRSLEAKSERWPDRQRLANSMKTTYLATYGGSREFNRLIDLDLKRREFNIVQRSGELRPERAKEIQEELVGINEQIDGLTRVVKGQLTNTQLGMQEPSQTIVTVATIGLLSLAVDSFSSAQSSTTTKVGPYVVIDQGLSSTVSAPEGQTFTCQTTVVPEGGSSMNCQPIGGKR